MKYLIQTVWMCLAGRILKKRQRVNQNTEKQLAVLFLAIVSSFQTVEIITTNARHYQNIQFIHF